MRQCFLIYIGTEGHDKPDVKPRTVEGRILKDADFLAGFGAWGILRIAMWAGETGRGIDQFLELVHNHMPKRVESLEFPESKCLALKETKFVRLFVSLLDQIPTLETQLSGNYIVLEGNGGVGKDTQAEILKQRFEIEGQKAIIVNEPSDRYRSIDNLWEEKFGMRLEDDGSMFRRFVIIGDRARLIRETVIPALREGITVISVRSFISMLVYQCESELDRICVTYLHQFVPIPDLVVLYDADEEICLKRIVRRGTRRGLFDRLEDLKKYRPLFLKIANVDYLDCPIEIVDAGKSEDEVAKLTWSVVKKYL
jgi:dTMP kinase